MQNNPNSTHSQRSMAWFDPEPGSQPKAKAPDTWYFVTNQLNLMYMLAAGMILPPAGFGDKYYEDSLSVMKGWIPVFPEKIPGKMIDMSVRETRSLKPVVVALNLASVKGPCIAAGPGGKTRAAHLPEDRTEAQIGLFLPAPLPTVLIEAICFQSADDKKECEKDAADYTNVPLNAFKRVVRKTLFQKSGPDIVMPAGSSGTDHSSGIPATISPNISMDRFLAYGAMLAMLLHCGNMGDDAARACLAAFGDSDSGGENAKVLFGSLEDRIANEMEQGGEAASSELFWAVVEEIIHAGEVPGERKAEREVVLALLERSVASLDGKTKEAMGRLADDLRSLNGLGDKSATELLEDHAGPFRRALILFFLRDRCTELLDFFHFMLNEQDYLAACLLFAAREKWIGLPLGLRDSPGLERAVSIRMAAAAHRYLKTGLSPGPAPPQCPPLRELLRPAAGEGGRSGTWSKKQKDAALLVAREMKWGCITTSIRLAKGEYDLRVDGGGVSIHLPGEVKAVETRVDMASFFSSMSTARFVDRKTESRARAILSR